MARRLKPGLGALITERSAGGSYCSSVTRSEVRSCLPDGRRWKAVAFSLRPSQFVMASAGPCRTVGLQFGLQTHLPHPTLDDLPQPSGAGAGGGKGLVVELPQSDLEALRGFMRWSANPSKR